MRRADGAAGRVLRPDHRLGVDVDLHRARRRPRGGRAGRARPGHGRPRRPAAAARVRLAGGALVGREGVHRPGAGPRRGSCRSPSTSSTGCASTALAAAIEADVAAGRRPIAVVATVGTTSSTSIDPSARSPTCAPGTGCGCTSTPPTAARRRSCRSCAGCCDDCERADSMVINPHKWLLTPMDCSLLWTSRARIAARRLLAGAGVPAQRAGRGRQPDGLRPHAGPALPRAEAVDGAARLRRRGPGGGDRRARATCAAGRSRGQTLRRTGSCWRRCRSRRSTSATTRPGVDDETELERHNQRFCKP